MAVVQISKIQVRRGQKNSSSGVPQLSSAEFAWAVDTQELFIGNGSVQEGAPYVGNTKIITEHDNILELASSYRYAANDPAITSSVSRTLQSKIDEVEVSVKDFGAVGDGNTDNVFAFQTAFTELFRNADTNYRKVLVVPNGDYLFDNDLLIPSNAIIRGETSSNVILRIGSNNIRLVTASGSEETYFDSTNRPENIQISDLTIRRTTGQVILTGLVGSIFKNVTIRGNYVLGSSVNVSTDSAAVTWVNNLAGTKVDRIQFKDCFFESNGISVKAVQTEVFGTTVLFDGCFFNSNDTAIYISGVENQVNNWRIYDCRFEEIANQVFRSLYGTDTLIQRCEFKNCGNNTNTAATPTAPIVYFGEKKNNLIIDCTSNRQRSAGIITSDSAPLITEVYNSDKSIFIDRNHAEIYKSDGFRPLMAFSAENRYYVVNYFLKLSSYSRIGQLLLSIDDDFSHVSISDHYQYSPSLVRDSGGSLMTNFEFDAVLKDNDTDSGIDTIVIYYKNPLITGATGTISFDVTYGV